MPHKRYFSAVIAVAPAGLEGIAWAGYGDDRALHEDLQARGLFAFEFGDPEGYFGTLTPGEVKGRDAIARFIFEGRTRTEETRAKRLRTRSADPR